MPSRLSAIGETHIWIEPLTECQLWHIQGISLHLLDSAFKVKKFFTVELNAIAICLLEFDLDQAHPSIVENHPENYVIGIMLKMIELD